MLSVDELMRKYLCVTVRLSDVFPHALVEHVYSQLYLQNDTLDSVHSF